MRRSCTSGLLLLCLLSLGSAQAVGADWLTTGTVSLHAPTGLTAFSQGLYLPDLDNAGLTVTAPMVLVEETHVRQIRGPVVEHRLETRPATYYLTNATIHLSSAGPDSYLGAYLDPKEPLWLADSSATSTARRAGIIGNGAEAEKEPNPTRRTFAIASTSPHLLVEAGEFISYDGRAALKLRDVELSQTSSRNASTINARHAPASGPAGEETIRWVFLDFPLGAHIEIYAAQPAAVLAARVDAEDAALSSTAGFRPLNGGGNAARLPMGSFSLAAQQQGDDVATRATMVPPILASQGRVTAPFATSEAPAWPFALGAVLALAGGALAVHAHRRSRHRAPGLSEALDLDSASAGLLGPQRQEAVELALAKYDEILATNARDGRAAVYAAQLAAREGLLDQADAYVEIALRRDPRLLHMLLVEEAIAAGMRTRPRFEAALAAARRRLS